jgi:serine/threonine protein kinase
VSRNEHDNLVGEILDEKYRVEKPIGQGGMGAVYLATHEGTGRLVALKVITPELMADEHVVERFKREARAAGRICHPNVVNVTDFGFTTARGERLAYLVMEHLQGRTLEQLLGSEHRLPLALTIDILGQTCAAVEEAHRHGIIHRDLKPENIWLEDRPAGGYHVKVLDFGVAKLRAGPAERAPLPSELPADLDRATLAQVNPGSETLPVSTPPHSSRKEPASPGLTDMGILLGTPLYMSPEQWLNLPADARTDVYSLGVVAYRMLSGELPFTGKSTSLYLEHVRSAPPPLSERARDLPASSASVVMSALEKDRARRPQTPRAFATQLAAASEGGGALVRRAVALTAEHFPALARLSLVVYGPILALAALRIAGLGLVAAGVLPAAIGHVLGTAAIVAHSLCVVFLVPACMGLFTPQVHELEATTPLPRRPVPSLAGVLGAVRRSLAPTALTTALSLGLVIAVRLPLEWLDAKVTTSSGGSADMLGAAVLTSTAIEVLTIFVFARVMGGLAVYPSVVMMERLGGLAALRRSLALTRPCRLVASQALLFHFLPRTLVVPLFLLAFAQFARLPYSAVISTSSDTWASAVAIAGLNTIYVLIAPFGMTALSLLYLKTRRIQGDPLDDLGPVVGGSPAEAEEPAAASAARAPEAERASITPAPTHSAVRVAGPGGASPMKKAPGSKS